MPKSHHADHGPQSGRHPKGSWAEGIAAGLVATALGLAVAELTAAGWTSMQSPLLDIGDRVVDGAPRPLKDLAIAWFGTNDKVALLVGVGTVLALASSVAGYLALSRHRVGAVTITAACGALGMLASLTTRRQAPWTAAIPSLTAAAVAALALLALARLRTGRGQRATPSIAEVTPTGRRRFLAGAAVTFAGAAALGHLGWRFGRTGGEQRQAIRLPQPAVSLPPPNPGVTHDVEGITPFFTPNERFYRIDTALSVPQVELDDWRLTVSGLVERPLVFSYDELLRRELVEADITLVCVSNEVGGNLLGTARWLGVRLDELLDEAGVDPSADQVVGRSVDGYTCGFPVRALDGRPALVALGMNGEPLPGRHGFPARLVVPGLYGYVSATKWLTEIELTRFVDFDQYWVRRGWDAEAPIKTQSRIDVPRGLARLPAGPVPVAGVAWAPTRGIGGVQVRIDDGPWLDTVLADEHRDTTWRQWRFTWHATTGRHVLRVRAIDGTGAIQPETRSEPFPNGASGHHQIVVFVD